MQHHTLAIIIPSWNCEDYISEMLDSILANTFEDYKVFVVDDHSTDKTQDILKQYHERDKRIELHIRNRDPKGAQTCRNIGLELSKDAKYVIWFDADDLVAPYCFEQRVSYMEKHPELDFAVFPAKRFSTSPYDFCYDIWGVDYLNDPLRCFLNRTLMMVGWTNIYKRESVQKEKLTWDEKVLSLQDADWNIQSICAGLTFDYASKEGAKFDYFYRTVSSGIASKIKTAKHCKSHLYHIKKTLSSLSDYQLQKYEPDINGTLVQFAIIFNTFDVIVFKNLLKIDWFTKHPILRIKLRLYQYLGGRGKYRLFKKELQYHNKIHSDWWELKKMYYIETLNTQNN